MARVKTPEEVLTSIIKGLTKKWYSQPNPEEHPFSEYLARGIEIINTLKEQIRETYKAEEREQKRHHENLIIIKSDRDKIQETCPHYSRTYHGDPSGGSDSHEVCDICRKTWS